VSVLGLWFALALLALGRFGWTERWWALLPLLIALAVIMVLDLQIRIIPDVVTLPGIAYACLRWAPAYRNAGARIKTRTRISTERRRRFTGGFGGVGSQRPIAPGAPSWLGQLEAHHSSISSLEDENEDVCGALRWRQLNGLNAPTNLL